MEIFQTFDYNGRTLQLAAYESELFPKPAKASSTHAPGAGKFEIGQIILSAQGEDFVLTTEVSGKNIAYIYTEILLKDKNLNQFYGPVAREYVRADQEKEVGGVSHPAWDETTNLSVRLSPKLRLLTDGADSAFGFLIPESYNKSDYQLDGLYISSNGPAPRRARITFDNNGQTKQVVAFKEKGNHSTPHELTLKQDDQFVPFAQIFTPPAQSEVWHVKTALTNTLTFRGQPLHWITEALMPADYLIGLLIQDLDGGFTRKYSSQTIR